MSTQLNTGAASPETQVDEPGAMSWIDHLRELRNRLFVASVAVVIGMVIGFVAVTWDNYALIEIIFNHVVRFTGADAIEGLSATGTAEVFTSAIRVAFVIGLSLAMPVVVYELLAFIVPGLTSREKRIMFVVLPFITICFVGGLAFGWYVTVPAAITFLQTQGVQRFLIIPSISDFIGLFTRLILINGVLFEMPVIVYAAIWLGAVKRDTLTKYRRYAILVIVIIASIVTPTSDPINLALVAVPMYLLYELGLLLALLAPRRPDTSGTPGTPGTPG